jgi:hypothetical protein
MDVPKIDYSYGFGIEFVEISKESNYSLIRIPKTHCWYDDVVRKNPTLTGESLDKRLRHAIIERASDMQIFRYLKEKHRRRVVHVMISLSGQTTQKIFKSDPCDDKFDLIVWNRDDCAGFVASKARKDAIRMQKRVMVLLFINRLNLPRDCSCVIAKRILEYTPV